MMAEVAGGLVLLVLVAGVRHVLHRVVDGDIFTGPRGR